MYQSKRVQYQNKKEEFSFFKVISKKINTESQRCGFSHAHNLNSKVKYVMDWICSSYIVLSIKWIKYIHDELIGQ